MQNELPLSATARACRYIASICFLAAIFTLTIAGSLIHQKQQRTVGNDSLARPQGPSISKRFPLEASSPDFDFRGIEPPEQPLMRNSLQIDVTTTNITVILENIQVEGGEDSDAPWMYSESPSPFEESENFEEGVRAFTRLSWNPNGTGDGSCDSDGSGRISRGYLDPYNYNLKMEQDVDFDRTRVELRNLSLSEFVHINTVYADTDWAVMGQAGDERRYSHGSLQILKGNEVLLDAINVKLFQNTSYPTPVGEAPEGSMYMGGYFLGEINEFGSNDEWVNQLDPFGMGYVLGIVSAASFGPPSCITANSYWVTLRGFPDLKRPTLTSPYAPSLYNDSRRSGAKSGIYLGSNLTDIETAETLANTSKSVVASAVSISVISAAGSAAAAVVAPGAVAAPPGQGVFRLVSNTAFVAKINEIYGFHSDAMTAFGDGMKPFIGKLEFPFQSETIAESRFGRWFMKTIDLFGRSEEELAAIVRQESDESATVSDELFGGCAFYISIILVGFMALHLTIWLATRKKRIELQLTAHAWMIYIFSIVMSYVYTASILNSMQYLRSHVSNGTGKIGLYIVAFLQLLFIGIGFTIFFVTVMFLAVKRVRNKQVKWVPRDQIPNPRIRNKHVIRGEYQVGDKSVFHTLFECYYSSMAGPRLWLAGIELIIVFLDAICTATIWNEVICFAVLICVYAVLFVLFLTFAPFVDKIEGRLITTLGLIDLVLLIVEFMGALGDYETAEKMEQTAVVIGFVSIGFAVLIAVYSDLLPMAFKGFKFLRRQCRQRILGQKENLEDNETGSEWSFISKSDDSKTSSALDPTKADERQVVGEQDTFKGLISQVFKIPGTNNEHQGGSGHDGPAQTLDWRRNKSIDWRTGSPDVTPTSDGRLRILNSADSDDAIEWPMVGQVIYSVRDLHEGGDAGDNERGNNENEEEYQTDEEEGLIHVQEEQR